MVQKLARYSFKIETTERYRAGIQKMIGIYKIENLINGKVYIGQSLNLNRRITRHKCVSVKLEHRESSKPLYRAIRKYGIENFTFEIIHLIESKDSLNKLEKYYIELYSSNFSKYGYNLNLDDHISTFNKLNIDILKSIILELKSGTLKKDIANKFEISVQLINGINRGDINRVSCEKYPIRLKNDPCVVKSKEYIRCKKCKTLTKNKKFCSDECSYYNQRKIKNRPSVEKLHEELLHSTYRTIGLKYNVSDNTIRKWIK